MGKSSLEAFSNTNGEAGGVVLSTDPLDRDSFTWSCSRGGAFRVRDAYVLARGEVARDDWGGWGPIWKLKIQERVKVF